MCIMSNFRESFHAVPMLANANYLVRGSFMGGFLTKTAGAISVVDAAGVVLIDAIPLTAGVYTPIPISFNSIDGGTVTLSGGASGTLFV